MPRRQNLSAYYAEEAETLVRKNLLRHTLDPALEEDRGWVESKCREFLEKAQADFDAAENEADATVAHAQALTAELKEMRERLEAAMARTEALRATDDVAESLHGRGKTASS